MNEPAKNLNPWPKRIRLTLIPALLVVLAAVVYLSTQPTASPSVVELANGQIPLESAPRRPRTTAQSPSKPKWPEIDLSETVSFNPFDRPTAVGTMFGSPSADKSKNANGKHASAATSPRLSSLPPGQVQAIFQTSAGTVAVIDSRIVHQGDVLESGGRIVSITMEAVIVEVD